MTFFFYPFISETAGFVDKLFESLGTKNYIAKPQVKQESKEEPKPAVPKSEEKKDEKEKEKGKEEEVFIYP